MMWSKEDFAREVRRQMVELQTLRKKAECEGSLEESIEKLEESQRYLLRKLEESFPPVDGDQEDDSSNFDSFEDLPPHIQACVKSILEEPEVIKELAQHVQSAEEGEAKLVIVGINAGVRFEELSGSHPAPPYSLN